MCGLKNSKRRLTAISDPAEVVWATSEAVVEAPAAASAAAGAAETARGLTLVAPAAVSTVVGALVGNV